MSMPTFFEAIELRLHYYHTHKGKWRKRLMDSQDIKRLQYLYHKLKRDWQNGTKTQAEIAEQMALLLAKPTSNPNKLSARLYRELLPLVPHVSKEQTVSAEVGSNIAHILTAIKGTSLLNNKHKKHTYQQIINTVEYVDDLTTVLDSTRSTSWFHKKNLVTLWKHIFKTNPAEWLPISASLNFFKQYAFFTGTKHKVLAKNTHHLIKDLCRAKQAQSVIELLESFEALSLSMRQELRQYVWQEANTNRLSAIERLLSLLPKTVLNDNNIKETIDKFNALLKKESIYSPKSYSEYALELDETDCISRTNFKFKLLELLQGTKLIHNDDIDRVIKLLGSINWRCHDYKFATSEQCAHTKNLIIRFLTRIKPLFCEDDADSHAKALHILKCLGTVHIHDDIIIINEALNALGNSPLIHDRLADTFLLLRSTYYIRPAAKNDAIHYLAKLPHHEHTLEHFERLLKFFRNYQAPSNQAPQGAFEQACVFFNTTAKSIDLDKVRKVYLQKCREFHPDKNPNPKATLLFLEMQKHYHHIQEHVHAF